MVLIPIDIIEKILKYKGSPFDSILIPFLRRAILSTNVKFASLLLFDKNKNLISMARFGEFEKEEIIRERRRKKTGFIPSILETMKPMIINDTENDPHYLSFRKDAIRSEMVYPFLLKDGKVAVLVLPSEELGHFKEEQIEEVEKILKDLSSSMEILEKNEGILLFRCGKYEGIIEDILGKEFNLFPLNKIEDATSLQFRVNLILFPCNFSCSLKCSEAFSLSRILKVPVVIIRPFTLRKENSSFSCSFYCPSSLSKEHEKIIEMLKESKFYVNSKEWIYEKRDYLKIASLQRYLVENELKSLKELHKKICFSYSYASSLFKDLIGMSIKEFFHRVKICNSLFLLVNGNSIRFASLKAGYRFKSSFTKAFSKIFSIAPSHFLKEKNGINGGDKE